MRIALVLSLVLALLAVMFALQNPAYMDVNLGPFDVHGSTALILMITFSIGVVVGILAALPGLIRRRKRIRELERQVAAPIGGSAPPGREPDSTTRDYGTL